MNFPQAAAVGRSIFAPNFLFVSILSKNNGDGRPHPKSSFSDRLYYDGEPTEVQKFGLGELNRNFWGAAMVGLMADIRTLG